MDTSYGIICSGLTDKTQFSFISSNSSFTKCERKPLKFSYVSSFIYHINSNSPTTYDHITFGTQTQNLPTSETYFTFNFCSWDNCCSEPAGAISCDQSGASLIVMKCKFNNCNSTSGVTATQAFNGGAIYVNGLNTFIACSSLFVNCRAPQTNHDGGGSGGIYIRSIKTVFSLSTSDFISCFTGSSGAGVFFYSSSNPKMDIEIITDCRCIQCRAQDQTPDGGGMCLWEWMETLNCINCLFSGCTSTGVGGGLDFYFGTNSESYPVKFCFFVGNSGTTGNDAFLYLLPNKENIVLLHCFSTISSNRIAYYLNSNVHITNN